VVVASVSGVGRFLALGRAVGWGRERRKREREKRKREMERVVRLLPIVMVLVLGRRMEMWRTTR
jgi:hypothetical protein